MPQQHDKGDVVGHKQGRDPECGNPVGGAHLRGRAVKRRKRDRGDRQHSGEQVAECPRNRELGWQAGIHSSWREEHEPGCSCLSSRVAAQAIGADTGRAATPREFRPATIFPASGRGRTPGPSGALSPKIARVLACVSLRSSRGAAGISGPSFTSRTEKIDFDTQASRITSARRLSSARRCRASSSAASPS